MSVDQMYDYLYDFVVANEPKLKSTYFNDQKYLEDIISLGMGMNLKKRRKDYIFAKQILSSISYYFDDLYTPEYDFKYEPKLTANIIELFLNSYNYDDDNNEWFNKLKEISTKLGFAADMSQYRAEPDKYPGNISDIAEVIRVATTGMKNTPDLWAIMQIMGHKRVINRLDQALIYLQGLKK